MGNTQGYSKAVKCIALYRILAGKYVNAFSIRHYAICKRIPSEVKALQEIETLILFIDGPINFIIR